MGAGQGRERVAFLVAPTLPLRASWLGILWPRWLRDCERIRGPGGRPPQAKPAGLRDKKEGDAAVALGWMVVGVVLGFGWWCLSVFTLDGRNRGVALR